ncbi:hypothetical protein P280DRAFT_389467 [Massarina eburnea CBS 473.64]|uniref:Rhodopsin domain-containing protein n=1 Tax=Massarina eburnea CBS 473.64 TaxID=1395130 RepID=A0A6A6SHV9_9PLEO|nr:hypothetical protein P280DRAFT_389467 [Massarina eburnea CBS 473.64]
MAPRTLQPSALALVMVPTVISTIVVCLRIWRRFVTRKFAIEDILLVMAQILVIVLAATSWKSFKLSWYGYHYWDIPPNTINKVAYQKWGFVNAVIYNPILGLIKASFVITLIKLRSPNRNINIALWSIFVINGLFIIAAPLVCAFQCSPVAKFWDRSIPGTCLDGAKYTYGTIGVVLVTDVAVLAMPTWILHNLQMPLVRKAMYILFMSFGIAVTAIGAFRLYVFVQLYTKENNPDTGYGIRQALSNVEISLAAIGACGGTVKWLLGRCIPFFNDQETPHLSKYNASRSSGTEGLESRVVNGRPRARRNANWSWRGRGRTGNSTIASREEEVVAPPPMVWKKVETRRRDRGTKKAGGIAGTSGEQQPKGDTVRAGSENRMGTSTTNASSSNEARPREVL